MRYLAILLFAPWLLLLCGVYWNYPKSLPCTSTRRWFDACAVALMLLALVTAALWGFDHTQIPLEEFYGKPSGAIWRQVAPALYGYGAFGVILLLSLLLRQRLWAPGKDRRRT